MLPINKCPLCEGKVEEKEVTEIIKGGNNTVTLTVNTLVCCRCGERFYRLETTKKFEEIKIKLQKGRNSNIVRLVSQVISFAP